MFTSCSPSCQRCTSYRRWCRICLCIPSILGSVSPLAARLMPAIAYRILPCAGLVEPPALNEFVQRNVAIRLKVVPFGRRSIHGDHEVFAGLEACRLDGFQDLLDCFLITLQLIRCKTTFITDSRNISSPSSKCSSCLYWLVAANLYVF